MQMFRCSGTGNLRKENRWRAASGMRFAAPRTRHPAVGSRPDRQDEVAQLIRYRLVFTLKFNIFQCFIEVLIFFSLQNEKEDYSETDIPSG